MTAGEREPGQESVSVEVRVRYAETDQMGVVYHSNYLIWCEIGRTELIRRRFVPYAELEQRGIMLAVADASLRYHAPARYDDRIRIDTWVSDVRSRTVTFDYVVWRVEADGDATRLATVATTLIGLGPGNRPARLPSELIEALRP